MKRRIPISNRIIVLNVLFTLFLAVIVLGLYTLATKDIVMEDDTPIPAILRYFMLVVFSFVGVGIVKFVFSIWIRVFTGRGAMTLTDHGIEDTFIIFNIFAFWTTLRVQIIPWDAISQDSVISELVKVDLKKMPEKSVGIIAKLMLRFSGFNASVGKIDTNELIAAKFMHQTMDNI